MLLTPTAIGALLAGAAFWCLFWAALRKLGKIPVLRDWLSTARCFAWIRQNQGLAFLMTEAFNFLIHGFNTPVGILFALGGTMVNFLFIFGYLPSRDVLGAISASLRRLS
jgi:hypothetical protein